MALFKRNWPKLQELVKQGVLLEIDLAYAQTQTQEEPIAALHAALLYSARQGHLCLEKSIIDSPLLQQLLPNGRFYLPKNLYFEDLIVQNIQRLLSYSKALSPLSFSDKLNQEQKQAVTYAHQFPLSILTGGPGTGKTFTALKIAESLACPTLFLAPTGKAAFNLQNTSSSSKTCGTLHSFLKIKEYLDYTKESSALSFDLVIVDECSMIDPPLFARLLQAITPTTTLVLIGDQNQLPAVEGGSVFYDLIDSKIIPTTTLSFPMRSDRLEILQLAQSVLEKPSQDLRNLDLGLFHLPLEKAYDNLWHHTKDLFQSNFQILSTLRKGPFGVEELNQFFFKKFSKITNSFPIMIQKNEPQLGLYNGDMGMLDQEIATFSNERKFHSSQLPSYQYAYCLSVHKSQGSEYDHVLLLVPKGSEAFSKEIIYTAVTRAKKTIEIEGCPDQIRLALHKGCKKLSGISEKLQALYQKAL